MSQDTEGLDSHVRAYYLVFNFFKKILPILTTRLGLFKTEQIRTDVWQSLASFLHITVILKYFAKPD